MRLSTLSKVGFGLCRMAIILMGLDLHAGKDMYFLAGMMWLCFVAPTAYAFRKEHEVRMSIPSAAMVIALTMAIYPAVAYRLTSVGWLY